jgi:type II secretory pathway pseudopilin PulG
MSPRSASRPAFTITELLIVIAVIIVLVGLLLPALGGVWRSAQMTKSMNNLRQIALWMQQYSSDNTEYVLPSRFDYTYPECPDCYRGHVCSKQVAEGQLHEGTWADILWTVNELLPLPEADKNGNPFQLDNGDFISSYRFNAPDRALYEDPNIERGDVINPLRSSVPNSRSVEDGTGPTPFGDGAQEIGLPGFFAANNFFDSRDPDDGGNGWFSTGQIRYPDRSMYLIDSYAGETIEDEEAPFDSADNNNNNRPDWEVDFRYGDICLLLFLDGHMDQQGPWDDICDLEGPGGRGIRVRKLDQAENPCGP